MFLKAHSDVSYLSESKARSRAGYFFYTSGINEDSNRPNGAITVISTIMRHVMSLSVKVVYGVLLCNAKEQESLRITLREMGHPQQSTEIITDNFMVDGIMRGTIIQKMNKIHGNALLLGLCSSGTEAI